MPQSPVKQCTTMVLYQGPTSAEQENSTALFYQRQRRDIYRPASKDWRAQPWRQPLPDAPYAWFLLAYPIVDQHIIAGAFAKIIVCLSLLRQRGLLLPNLQPLGFMDDQNRMTVRLVFPLECHMRPNAFAECMANMVAILHYLPSIDPPCEARSTIVKQLTLIGNDCLNICVPRWPANTDFYVLWRPDNSPKMVDIWYASLAFTVDRVCTHMDNELEKTRPRDTVHRSPAELPYFDDLGGFSRFCKTCMTTMIETSLPGVAASVELETQSTLEEIRMRLMYDAENAAGLKRSMCESLEKIVDIDKTEGLTLEQECARQTAAGHAAWLRCLLDLIEADKSFAQLLRDVRTISRVLGEQSAAAKVRQTVSLIKPVVAGVACYYGAMSGSLAVQLGVGGLYQGWTYADHRVSIRKLAVLLSQHLALSQNFRVQMWELRKEWAARKNRDVTSSMGRLKHWASDMEAHAKKMS